MPESIEIAYCLSQNSPSSNCPKCSEQCAYDDLRDIDCSIKCNSSSCGYDNLYCLESDNCYTFMLNDGNCNDLCSDDPDCPASDSVHLAAIIVPIIGGVIM